MTDSTSFESPQLLTDALHHDDMALALLSHLDMLPDGAVVAVQGPWGRGKTDVVWRAYERLDALSRSGDAPKPLWLQPWRYGSPDLITPLVLELMQRVPPPDRTRSSILRRAARTLLRAASATVFKGLSVVAPGPGTLLAQAADPVDDFITSLFEDGEDTSTSPDLDPVRAMADQFRHLVQEYIHLTASIFAPLVIVIDDLDRCLPDHQIAMLESVHFLTSASAPCRFLIAIDPTLVGQAALTHFKIDSFDIDLYLDKLFDLRVNLRFLRSEDSVLIARHHLERELRAGGTVEALLLSGLNLDRDAFLRCWPRVFFVPSLNNPRLVTRATRRLELWARANLRRDEPVDLSSNENLMGALSWIAICERWPSLRIVPQVLNVEQLEPTTLYERFRNIAAYFGGQIRGANDERIAEWAALAAADTPVVSRLPLPAQAGDLGTFLSYMLGDWPGVNVDSLGLPRRWTDFDRSLRLAAL